MKSFFLFLLLLPVLSCDKTGCLSNSLDGKWKMILVKNNTTPAGFPKPAGIAGDVIITFTTSSSTTGKLLALLQQMKFMRLDFPIHPQVP
jgi:hypothetical protein